jgi:hypothetical protein
MALLAPLRSGKTSEDGGRRPEAKRRKPTVALPVSSIPRAVGEYASPAWVLWLAAQRIEDGMSRFRTRFVAELFAVVGLFHVGCSSGPTLSRRPTIARCTACAAAATARSSPGHRSSGATSGSSGAADAATRRDTASNRSTGDTSGSTHAGIRPELASLAIVAGHEYHPHQCAMTPNARGRRKHVGRP